MCAFTLSHVLSLCSKRQCKSIMKTWFMIEKLNNITISQWITVSYVESVCFQIVWCEVTCVNHRSSIPAKSLIYGPFTNMCLLSVVYFIPRRESNFGPQTSHQSVHGNLIYLNIHSLYIQIWRITTKLAILFSTQQCGKMIFNTHSKNSFT